MKSYKTNPKILSNIFQTRDQQSDIFIQKGLNKPEIQYTHKRLIPKDTFKSSYNFLEWNDTSPHFNPSIKIKHNPNNISQILNANATNYLKYDLNKIPGKSKKHKSFYEKMHEDEPDNNTNKSDLYLNARYQKETMNLGDYEGNEYKIKKNKSMIYDPSPYLEIKNPLKQKMDLVYGGCDDLIGNSKPAINRNNKLVRSVSSIGFARRDFETKNEYDPKIRNNPKEMKYFLIYGNKGIENANKKLKPMSLARSTNNIYVPGEEPLQNRVNFLRSNIFNDQDREKMYNDEDVNDDINNGSQTIKVNRNLRSKKLGERTKSANDFGNKNIGSNISNNEDLDIKDNHSKRFLYKKNDEKLPVKLDWRDPQLYLLFPQNKNSDVLKKNARQRKFKEIYGTDPILPKKKIGAEFQSDDRLEIDEAAKNNFKDVNFSKMKRISENISQMQGNHFINDNNKKNNENNNNNKNKIKNYVEGLTYEIKSVKNKKLITNDELEKKFANKGLHIYDIKENMGNLLNNRNDNKIEFKIRENNKDNNLEGKINDIKKEFKDKGIVMIKKIKTKKENTDIIPSSLKWNNVHCGLLTKNIKADKSNERITHLKAPLNRKNEENVTKISVNLKYKAKPYNV